MDKEGKRALSVPEIQASDYILCLQWRKKVFGDRGAHMRWYETHPNVGESGSMLPQESF